MRWVVVFGHHPVPVGIQDQEGGDGVEGQVGLFSSMIRRSVSFRCTSTCFRIELDLPFVMVL